MNKIIISPSILSSDFSKLGAEVKMLENAGADWVHIDVMDGHFVPNLTIGAPVVKSLRKITRMPLDVHLMIDNPDKYIKDFINAGSDIITFHYEAAREKTEALIKEIHSAGIKAGISIKPKTPASKVFEYLDKADLILVMTVEPGFGGQKFMPECADKIAEFAQRIKSGALIEADGGINAETAAYCIKKGVNALVSGNYIFSASNPKQAVESLRN